MKWIIILVLFLLLIAFIAYRYRKHLQSAYFMWQTFRKFRRQMKPKEKQVEKKTRGGDTQLVRCPKCSKWTPQEEAVKLKQSFYCSLRCLEESVQFNK